MPGEEFVARVEVAQVRQDMGREITRAPAAGQSVTPSQSIAVLDNASKSVSAPALVKPPP